jgi:hypothetical protein
MINLDNIAVTAIYFGLALFSGSFLFGAGSLSLMGWLVMTPLFAGATYKACTNVLEIVSGVHPDEKRRKKTKVSA